MDEITYSLDQLEAETGFNKRKIRYYIQQVIGSGQGTGGRDARYPKSVRDKLLFIVKVQEHVTSLRLADFREIIEVTPDRDIARVADGIEPLEVADIRTTEGAREFEIKAKTGNRRKKVVAVTLDGSEPTASGRSDIRFSRRRSASEKQPDEWKVIKLDKDVELRVRGEHSSSKLKQLKLLGQLVKSILGSN
jgi:hypothetical protein